MRAFVITETDDAFTCGVQVVEPIRTESSDVLVKVEWSGVNYKDAMVAEPKSRVRRKDTLVGGVDAAGTVAESTDPTVPTGARVAVHGGSIGVARDGGFAEFVYVHPRYVSLLPASISTRVAMVIGTAGFTAMESVLALEDHGLARELEVLVTGATGGVGSHAVAYLAARGYRPVASTGSPDAAEWLLENGATRVISRDNVSDKPGRLLGSELWGGAIDCVGGETLAGILRSLRYGAAVAASGLVGSADLTTTVYPFITRSIALLGIDSVEASTATRQRVWTALAELTSRVDFAALVDRDVTLEELVPAIDDVRHGTTRGRILVDTAPS